MKLRHSPAIVACLFLSIALAHGDDPKPSTTRLSKENRMDIIRTFNAEPVYVRVTFPMGKDGLQVKDGAVSPSPAELQEKVTLWGAAAKPGDRALITGVTIKDDRMRFELNGGPVRKKKWYQRVEVSGAGGAQVPNGAPDAETNMHGSFVDLVFDHDIPEMTTQQLKDRLRPVFDFDAKTPLEAYLETVPPKAKEAIQHHEVLVGMNRDMVIFSKGRAPRKTRERDGDTEFEEWIYGDPPQQVDFVRFIGDEVIRVESMKVTGEKVIRTEKEVDVQTAVAKANKPEERPATAPTLRRPGEAPNPATGGRNPNGVPPAVVPPPPPIDDGNGTTNAPPVPSGDGNDHTTYPRPNDDPSKP